MKNYYADLMIESLDEAAAAISTARIYSIDAGAPRWMNNNLKKIHNTIRNRVDDVLKARNPKGEDDDE